MKLRDVIQELEELSDPKAAQGMSKHGISTEHALGISLPELRLLAKKIKRKHRLAKQLFDHEYHEARILGSMVADPAELTLDEIDFCTRRFDTWDQVDQYCINLFRHSKFAEEICTRYLRARDEFVKRTSFSMMAVLASHKENNWSDAKFERFLPIIEEHAYDNRKYVWKSVNWALRQIGKRSKSLHPKALKLAKKLSESEDQAERWVGRDAYRELSSEQVKKRL